ncbi:hypothetical protein GCM10027203_66390 [Nonomuraea fastidiosa]
MPGTLPVRPAPARNGHPAHRPWTGCSDNHGKDLPPPFGEGDRATALALSRAGASRLTARGRVIVR